MKSKKKKKIQVRNETDQQENAITGNLVRMGINKIRMVFPFS